MQLTMNLDVFSVPKPKNILPGNLWIDVTPEAHTIGFSQKAEISQGLRDALQPLRYEEEYDFEQRLYDAIWLAHHYVCLEQRTSLSFTFEFLRNDLASGRMIEYSLRLHLEICAEIARIGLLNDF